MANIVKGKFDKQIFVSNDGSFRLNSFRVVEVKEKDDDFEMSRYKTITLRTEYINFDFTQMYVLELLPIKNSKYKSTYIIKSMEESNDIDYSHIIKFLSSTRYKGLGEKTVQKLLDQHGADILEKIKSKQITNEDLNIKEDVYNLLLLDLIEDQEKQRLKLFLFECNLSEYFFKKVISFCSAETFFEKYMHEPWSLFYVLENITYTDILKIASHKAVDKVNTQEADQALIYSILDEHLNSSGNTRCLINTLKTVLMAKKPNMFKDGDLYFKTCLRNMNELKIIKIQKPALITTTKMFNYEILIMSKIKTVENKKITTPRIVKNDLLDPVQKYAVEQSLSKPLTIITGAPGTGKTLVTNEIIKLLRKDYYEDDIVVVTPTGRATINLNKNSLVNASTIHSLLRYDTETGEIGIKEESLKVKVLIIDEFSMVPTPLFATLLSRISSSTLQKIILVGDKDQLPAIGPGYLLNDFIENNIFKTIFLEKNYRQNESQGIIDDARMINEMQMPEFTHESSQFKNVPESKEEFAIDILNKVKELADSGYTKEQIAVLSPMYHYPTGINNLNVLLQNEWVSRENSIGYEINEERKVYINDKVMHTENDVKKDIFNGEIGYVQRIGLENGTSGKINSITVLYDGEKTVNYTLSEFTRKTMLAYCTSVHKYQGSESDIVLTVLFSEAKQLLSKKLIYTAITRAKKLSIIYGDENVLWTGINNDDDSKRSTSIKYLWDSMDKGEKWN
ncbi:ATP-dependent DNA helicase [Mycoplasma phocoenae]|uniref:AAA family ATPase n=1 Tax=Mycoplasma phocoenae TaxID=754517 RepID=A0A858U705_9MOLU|nr:AAA family ATPase [Mycoplasma phocoenae]QJG67227.1 AAA family ATPase [Mycoplasma phocoenae]